jgi:hypothetical protein
LLYAYKPKRNLSAFAEAGAGRSLAFAAGLEYGNRMTHLSAHFKYRPSSYPSLAIDNQHGVFSDLDFSRIVTKRLTVTARVDQDSFNLPIYRQDTLTASGNATVKVTHNLSVQGGVIFSDFKSSFPTRFSLQTTSGLTGVDFTSRHISAGAQYLPTVDSTNRLANGYSANLAGLLGRFQVSASYRHSVDLPTLVSLFSAVPGLQDALARTGVLISDPQQLQQFLANNAFLQTLGYTGNLNLNFAPARDDLGLNVDWAGNGTNQQRVSLSLLNSQTQLVTSNLNFRTGTLGYSRRLGFNNELIASLSAFQTRQGPTSTFTPVVQISFRHRFSAVPAGLLGGRHGNISGHVFHDDDAERHYPGIESGMAGVEVRLDERTSTRTDSEGYFEFRRVPYGFHTVQAKITDPRPYFFTTDSPATAAIDSVVDIGVSFVRGRLFGYIRNDAGGGIPGVELLLTGPAASRRIQAAFDGKFSVDGVAEGEYSLSTIAESYPDGYNLLGLPVQQVAVKVDRPSPVILVARALRSVSGSVSTHDPQTLAPTPLANAIVTIPELSRSARADKSGKYLFRDLPAGTFTIQVEHQGETVSHTVDLPGEPIVISNVDFSLRQRPN